MLTFGGCANCDDVPASLVRAAYPQVQRYAATLAAFRGRIPRALPLPAIDDDADDGDDPAPSSAFGHGRRSSTLGGFGKASIGGSGPGDDPMGGGLDGVVVSILLPTKSGLVSGVSAGAGGNDSSVPANFTTLDQIFVVVLKPRAQYATYSCALPSPVLV